MNAIEIKKLVLDYCYPVGSLYWTNDTRNPSDILGGGVWNQIKDKFILSAGDTYTKGSTGGEATHTLSTDEMPTHSHKYRLFTGDAGSSTADAQQGKFLASVLSANAADSYLCGLNTQSKENHLYTTGSSKAHNNMPPYVAYNCWVRVE